MHGNAKMTGGGLRKKDLKYNKQGKIVSKKMSQRAKKEKRLQKAGYTTVKGQFGTIRDMKGGNEKLNDDVSFFLYHLSADLLEILESPNKNINFNDAETTFLKFNSIEKSNNLKSIVTTIISILKKKEGKIYEYLENNKKIYEYLENNKKNLNKKKKIENSLINTIKKELISILTDNNITSNNEESINNLVKYLQNKSNKQVQEEEEESTEQVQEEEESTEQENINEKIKEILKTYLNITQNELNSLNLNNINTILNTHNIRRQHTILNFIGRDTIQNSKRKKYIKNLIEDIKQKARLQQ